MRRDNAKRADVEFVSGMGGRGRDSTHWPCVCRHRLLVYHIIKLLTALTMEPVATWSNTDALKKYCLFYKAAIVRSNTVPIFMDLLIVPLSLVGASRQDQDTGIIELILCLFRNLLQVLNCVPPVLPILPMHVSRLRLVPRLAGAHALCTNLLRSDACG